MSEVSTTPKVGDIRNGWVLKQPDYTLDESWEPVNEITAPIVSPVAVKQAPEVGFVKDGWKFKGGDPGTDENWEFQGAAAPQKGDTREYNGVTLTFGGGDPKDPNEWVDQSHRNPYQYLKEWGENVAGTAYTSFTDKAVKEEQDMSGSPYVLAPALETGAALVTGLASYPLAALQQQSIKHGFGHDKNNPNNERNTLEKGREDIVRALESMRGRADTTMMEQNLARLDQQIANLDPRVEYDQKAEVGDVDEYRANLTYSPRTKTGQALTDTLGSVLQPVGDTIHEIGYQAAGLVSDSEKERQSITAHLTGIADTVLLGFGAKGVAERSTEAGRAKVAETAEAKRHAKSPIGKIEKLDEGIADLTKAVTGFETKFGKGSAEAKAARSQLEIETKRINDIKEPLAKKNDAIQDAAADKYLRSIDPVYDAARTAGEASKTAASRKAWWQKARTRAAQFVGWAGAEGVALAFGIPGAATGTLLAGKGIMKVASAAKAIDKLIQRSEEPYTSKPNNGAAVETLPKFEPTKSLVPETQTTLTATMEPMRQPIPQAEPTITVDPVQSQKIAEMKQRVRERDAKAKETEILDADVSYTVDSWVAEANKNAGKTRSEIEKEEAGISKPTEAELKEGRKLTPEVKAERNATRDKNKAAEDARKAEDALLSPEQILIRDRKAAQAAAKSRDALTDSPPLTTNQGRKAAFDYKANNLKPEAKPKKKTKKELKEEEKQAGWRQDELRRVEKKKQLGETPLYKKGGEDLSVNGEKKLITLLEKHGFSKEEMVKRAEENVPVERRTNKDGVVEELKSLDTGAYGKGGGSYISWVRMWFDAGVGRAKPKLDNVALQKHLMSELGIGKVKAAQLIEALDEANKMGEQYAKPAKTEIDPATQDALDATSPAGRGGKPPKGEPPMSLKAKYDESLGSTLKETQDNIQARKNAPEPTYANKEAFKATLGSEGLILDAYRIKGGNESVTLADMFADIVDGATVIQVYERIDLPRTIGEAQMAKGNGVVDQHYGKKESALKDALWEFSLRSLKRNKQ